MNVEQYKKNQELRLKALSESPMRRLCFICYKSEKACFCSEILPFETRTEVVLLMHPKEAKKEKVGTGRLTKACLKNAKLLVGINFDQHPELQKLLQDPARQVFLLYPGEESTNLDRQTINPKLLPSDKIPVVLILDGTWACAKTMMRESSCLHHLPRLSFENTVESRFIIKQQPAKYCLSTIESVHALLHRLDHWGIEKLGGQHQLLITVLERLVRYQLDCASDPERQSYRPRLSDPERRGYRPPNERKPAKKWESWRVCYEEKNYRHQIPVQRYSK